MAHVSSNELAKYFASRNNRFVNLQGMEIISQELGVFTQVTLFTYDNGPFEMVITTADEGSEDFIDGFTIKKIDDIDTLSYDQSWVRYLNGNAEILITPMELEATFSFRIYKSRTAISSLELHFYDEEYKHLTVPEEFLEYFSRNERMLRRATENRYKY